MIRKQVTRDELERLYQTMTVREACEELGTNMYTFYKLIDEAGIPRRRRPYKEQTKFEIVG
jgi:hypothetical protein